MEGHSGTPSTLISSATMQKTGLLGLPDDAMLQVFAHLGDSENLILFDLESDSRNLAATHPRFDELHRRMVVKSLLLRVSSKAEAEGQNSTKVQQQLRHYAGAERLQIDFQRWGRGASIAIEAFMSANLRIVEIGDAKLDWGNIRGLMRACPSLLDLGLKRCSWRPGQEDEAKKFQDREKKTWSQLQNLGLWKSSDVFLRLSSNFALFELHDLREVDISGSKDLKGSMFDVCARFQKLTRLSVQSTQFSCADAARILPALSSLQELVVSQCRAIDSTLWASLPPSLVVLRASGTWFLRKTFGMSAKAGPHDFRGSLRVLEADFSGMKSWRSLSSGFSQLQELYLAYSKGLGDDQVEAALVSMPQLEKLNLYGCTGVGDRTAAAIARHHKLSQIWVQVTGIGEAGEILLRHTYQPSKMHTHCPHCASARSSSTRPHQWEYPYDLCPRLRLTRSSCEI